MSNQKKPKKEKSLENTGALVLYLIALGTIVVFLAVQFMNFFHKG